MIMKNIKVEMNFDEFLDVFCALANPVYQKRVWVQKLGPQADSFIETVCNFCVFYECNLENYKQYEISEIQYQSLIKFNNKF